MSLKSDTYDITPAVERLIKEARHALGSAGFRMVAPELESFIRCEVADALHSAFSKAEALYINESVKRANQSSATLIEGVLAGVELGRRHADDEKN